MRWPRRLGLWACLVCAGVTASAVAFAVVPDSGTGVITGCYLTPKGSLRVVDAQAGATCSKGEVSLTWNQTGPAGRNGNTVINGVEAPANTVGADGDFYLATGDNRLYGPKANNSWPVVGVSLVGPPGPAGPRGPAGVALNSLQVATLRWHEANLTGTTFAVGPTPYGAAFDGANLWITGENNIAKLRVADGAGLGTFATGDRPRAVAFDGANIWVANYDSNNVTKLRASDGAALGTFPVGTRPTGLAFDGANIWVANRDSNNVTKLRASDGEVLGTFAGTGLVIYDVAFDGVHIWTSTDGNAAKYRVSDGAVVDQFFAGTGGDMAFDGTNMWMVTVFGNADGVVRDGVSKVRASDGTYLGAFAADSPSAVAFDGANIWVTNWLHNSVTKLRASDGSRVGVFPVGQEPRGAAFDGVNMWVVNQFSGTVSKL